MVRMYVLLFTIFLPALLITAPAQPPVTPTPTQTVTVTLPPNPEVLRYGADVARIWQNYVLAAGALTQLAADVAQTPRYIQTQEFTNDVFAITTWLRIIREQLDDTPSPTPVEQIHRELEQAANLFTLASLKLDIFARDHDLDDFVDALDLIVAGTALWRNTIEKLEAVAGTTIEMGPALLP